MADETFFDVSCELAPKSIGPYSQAVMVSGVLFVSGQIGLCPKTMQLLGSDISTQTLQAIENLKSILTSVKMDISCVAKTTVFLKSMKDYDKFNQIYEKNFIKPFPARSVVQVVALPMDALVEIEAVAVVRVAPVTHT